MWKALAAVQQPVVREPLTDEQIEDYCFAAIRIGRDAARGIKGMSSMCVASKTMRKRVVS